MRLLLAAPDRDLLLSYKKLLELDGHNVTTVFDGPQLITRISENSFELVVLDRNLPRMDYRSAMKLLGASGIPSVVILPKWVTPEILLFAPGASSYMNYPFLPSDLRVRIEQVHEKASSGALFTVGGVKVNVGSFCAEDKTPYTNEEINILRALKEGESLELRHISAYINSLNNKFSRMGKKARIKYVPNEGYRLVNEYE